MWTGCTPGAIYRSSDANGPLGTVGTAYRLVSNANQDLHSLRRGCSAVLAVTTPIHQDLPPRVTHVSFVVTMQSVIPPLLFLKNEFRRSVRPPGLSPAGSSVVSKSSQLIHVSFNVEHAHLSKRRMVRHGCGAAGAATAVGIRNSAVAARSERASAGGRLTCRLAWAGSSRLLEPASPLSSSAKATNSHTSPAAARAKVRPSARALSKPAAISTTQSPDLQSPPAMGGVHLNPRTPKPT